MKKYGTDPGQDCAVYYTKTFYGAYTDEPKLLFVI